MKLKLLLSIAVVGLIATSVFFLSEEKHTQLNEQNSAISYETIKTSGAGKALDLWTYERAYPESTIATSKYLDAFAEEISRRGNRDSNIEGEWESLGPQNVGGRMLSMAFHPTNPDIIFAGSASGGLWKTTTQGVGADAWAYIPTGFPVLGVGAIAIDPNDPDIIIIGTGETYGVGFAEPGVVNRLTRGTYGIGILKTIDGGSSWDKVLSFDEEDIVGVQDIEISSTNSSEMFAATTNGVYRSLNGGDDWSLIFTQPNCFDIEIDPTNGNTLYVTQGNFNYGLDPSLSGIFKSTNKGDSFFELTDANLLSAWSGNAKLSIDPNDSNTLFASVQVGWFNTDPTTPGGIFKSSNGGVNWSYINNQNIAQFQGWYSHDIDINPNNSNEVINVGIDVWKSTNNGNNFTKKSNWQSAPLGQLDLNGDYGSPLWVHADIHVVRYHPLVANKIFFATDGGIFSSEDGGETFTTHNGGLQTGQFYPNMGSSATDPSLCIAGAQDNATYIYKGDPSWFRVIGGDGMSASIRQDDDQIIFGSFQNLNILRSTNAGDNFQNVTPTKEPNDVPAFLGPYELAPSNNDIIYAGSRYMYKSLNGADSWSTISNGTVDGTNAVLNISVSNQDSDVLYITTSPNPLGSSGETPKVMKSIDGGINFSALTGLPNRVAKDVEVDPNNDNIVYVTFSGFGNNHVFRTENGGANWDAIDLELPDLPTNTILIDPENSAHLYVGNDLGVYYSNDSGDSWESFSDALPEATMIYDLDMTPSNRKVRIATHGHGIWQRDLVDPLNIEDNEFAISNFSIYPNPANQSTTVSVDISQSVNSVKLSLYNPTGQLVDQIFEGNLSVGIHKFILDDLEGLSSGIYFVKLEGDRILQTKQLLKE